MNKKFKKKIAVLSSILSIYSAQNLKPVNATNEKIIKGLAIGIPSLLGSAGLIWCGINLVNYLKSKSNNNNEIEDPGLIKDTAEIEKAKKLLDKALDQDLVTSTKYKSWCKHIEHGLELGEDFAKDKGFYQEAIVPEPPKLPPNLKKFANYHFGLMRDCWNKNREKFSVLKRPGPLTGFEDLIFKFENLAIRLTVAESSSGVCGSKVVKKKQLIDLGIIFGPKNYTSCLFCFEPKDICFLN